VLGISLSDAFEVNLCFGGSSFLLVFPVLGFTHSVFSLLSFSLLANFTFDDCPLTCVFFPVCGEFEAGDFFLLFSFFLTNNRVKRFVSTAWISGVIFFPDGCLGSAFLLCVRGRGCAVFASSIFVRCIFGFLANAAFCVFALWSLSLMRLLLAFSCTSFSPTNIF
jgi:hypothetical protein